LVDSVDLFDFLSTGLNVGHYPGTFFVAGALDLRFTLVDPLHQVKFPQNPVKRLYGLLKMRF
jgi:hypothetical protein